MFQLYTPSFSELPKERIRAHRSLMSAVIRSESDVDTSPNTAFGDLFVSPAGIGTASLEESWRRFFSDMNLENVAAGQVYNCDFVRHYLSQLGFSTLPESASTGLVRLTLASSTEIVIPRTLELSVGDEVFRLLLRYEGDVKLTSLPQEPDQNYAVIYQSGVTQWFCDVLITGRAGASLSAGSALDPSADIPGLVSVTALGGFQSGLPPASVSELAARALTNVAAAPCTRAGIMAGAQRILSDNVAVGCIVSGDAEMSRDESNPLSVAGGRADLLVKSRELVADIVVCRLDLIDTGSGSVFFGEVKFPRPPVLIDSVTSGGWVISNPQKISVPSAAPGYTNLGCAYGPQERIFIRFPRPVVSGVQLPVLVDEGDTPVSYALFAIGYRYDPALDVARAAFPPDSVPLGVDLYTRGFTPLVVESLNVRFYRKRGVSLNIAAARQEIIDRLNLHSFHRPAGAADVVDSMYYAGAHSVSSMELSAVLRLSSADFFRFGSPPAAVTGPTSHAAFMANVVPINHAIVTDFISPSVDYEDDVTGSAAGPRSVAWILPGSALILSEIATRG